MSRTGPSAAVVRVRRHRHGASLGRVALVALVVVLAAVAVGAVALYLYEARDAARARQESAGLSAQLAETRKALGDGQADLDTARQALAQSEAEAADARANADSLAAQLAEAQQSEVAARALQAERDDLAAQLAGARKAAEDAEAKSASLGQKMTGALAKAQLLNEYFELNTALVRGDSPDEVRKGLTAWYRKLSALNDPTIDKYLAEYDEALAKDPNSNEAYSSFLAKLLAYLSDGVVTGLQ